MLYHLTKQYALELFFKGGKYTYNDDDDDGCTKCLATQGTLEWSFTGMGLHVPFETTRLPKCLVT